jgi:uncharacterized protein YPO0396
MENIKVKLDTTHVSLPGNVSSSAFILKQLEVYNWGPFDRPEPLEIDPLGTAIVGPTGSGKTTLVDAFMTLITPAPKYNLASTGGHESDRDLISYVRGVTGAGNNTGDNSHIARPGKTATAISAIFTDGKATVCIGALFWIDGTGFSHADLHRAWLFSNSMSPSMEDWLIVHHEGGIRALKQLARDTEGFQIFDSKKRYIAHLRRFFEVGENAFALLNRAAGLKQLNSIDEIFRELVLDDRAGFQRAAEVAQEFDTLKGIRLELEVALDQQKSLLPIERRNKAYQSCENQLKEQGQLLKVLPVWFAVAGHRMWGKKVIKLEKDIKAIAQDIKREKQNADNLQEQADTLKEVYLKAGGAGVEHLKARIAQQKENIARVKRDAGDYKKLTHALDLNDSLTEQALIKNQDIATDKIRELQKKTENQEKEIYRLGLSLEQNRQNLDKLKEEKEKIEARPGSNMPPNFQVFRTALAQALDLSENNLPFVAEMVEIKADEARWRGAVERAIGGHRLRILVPLPLKQKALQWVNNRDNRLYIRLLSISPPKKPPLFLKDGFTRKLKFKKHPQRELLKHLLAKIDRHCVETAQELTKIPFGMTPQGLMSGSKGLYEKQDQKPLTRDWMTGFSNKDRLVDLNQQISQLQTQIKEIQQQFDTAKARSKQTFDNLLMLSRIGEITFDNIDLSGATLLMGNLEKQLAILTDPESTVGKALKKYEQVALQVKAVHDKIQLLSQDKGNLEARLTSAASNRKKAAMRIKNDLSESQKGLAKKHLPALKETHLAMIGQMERDERNRIEMDRNVLQKKQKNMGQDLVRLMGKAKNMDTGALTDAGTDIIDIPQYLERLSILTREALPKKRKRFLEYLTQSSDQGVTQLLTYIQNEVAIIEERIDDLNHTLKRVDFKPGCYLKLEPKPVSANSMKTLISSQRRLKSAALKNDEGESHYRALEHMVNLLRDASERRRTVDARALLDPRYRLKFRVSEIERRTDKIIEIRSGSQGGSGGEKEIIASYILTASLSYALCPDGASNPLFATIILDEAFSKSSQSTAGRIILALREFGLHPLFVTPNKEMRLLRSHTRSAVLIHRKGARATMTSLSWKELDAHARKRNK